MVGYDNKKVENMKKIFALMLGDKKKYLAITYRYCLDTPLKDVKVILGKSYTKTKNALSKADKVYNIELLCKLSEDVIEYEAREVFKEVNGRYRCKWCGRYVTKRGRVQHLLKYHDEILKEIAEKYAIILTEETTDM